MKKHIVSLPRKKTSTGRFDPFNHRLSRDIRNSLAEVFVDALRAADQSCYQRTADQWLAKNLADAYAGYIRDRLKRYDDVLEQIKGNSIIDAKRQVLVSWNHGLFFEVHEQLEQIWLETNGDEYQALKGLIQAAGVYIHLEFDHRPAAEKLAAKSSHRIQKYAGSLSFIGNLDMLLDKLNNLDQAPPLLTP
jgi:hypothetical protein